MVNYLHYLIYIQLGSELMFHITETLPELIYMAPTFLSCVESCCSHIA